MGFTLLYPEASNPQGSLEPVSDAFEGFIDFVWDPLQRNRGL